MIHLAVSYVRHYVFGCRGCVNRLWIPIEEHQAASVGLVCDQCKRVASYSLDDSSHNYDPTGESAESESRFDVMALGTLRCGDGTCESPLPMFALRPLSVDSDERLAELRTWIWLDVKCSEGHQITNPGYFSTA
jgi:hypothetical protein